MEEFGKFTRIRGIRTRDPSRVESSRVEQRGKNQYCKRHIGHLVIVTVSHGSGTVVDGVQQWPAIMECITNRQTLSLSTAGTGKLFLCRLQAQANSLSTGLVRASPSRAEQTCSINAILCSLSFHFVSFHFIPVLLAGAALIGLLIAGVWLKRLCTTLHCTALQLSAVRLQVWTLWLCDYDYRCYDCGYHYARETVQLRIPPKMLWTFWECDNRHHDHYI